MQNHVDVCDIQFSLFDYTESLLIFEKWIQDGTSHQVCVTNVHSVVTCLWDKEFGDVTRSADMVTMDSHPIRWYANAVYGVGMADRVTGPDLMLKTIEYGLDKNWRHYFLGSTTEVLDALVNKFKEEYPGIKITGFHSPPFRQLTKDEDKNLVNAINEVKPDFLWVGLGAPKQEKWIYDHRDRLHVPVQIGVGAAFDFHSENVKRAPLFMRKRGLEWLYRIYQDPRLWKRYLKTNPIFLAILMRDIVRTRIFKNRNKPHSRSES